MLQNAAGGKPPRKGVVSRAGRGQKRWGWVPPAALYWGLQGAGARAGVGWRSHSELHKWRHAFQGFRTGRYAKRRRLGHGQERMWGMGWDET